MTSSSPRISPAVLSSAGLGMRSSLAGDEGGIPSDAAVTSSWVVDSYRAMIPRSAPSKPVTVCSASSSAGRSSVSAPTGEAGWS